MAVQPIPVVPAAHYQCGGVVTDLQGRTALPSLLAVGEVACTGLHGANRLASNSLLEGLVFGRRAARQAAAELLAAKRPAAVPDWNPGDALAPDEGVVVAHNWDELRRLMWNYVGIVRSVKRLERARTRLRSCAPRSGSTTGSTRSRPTWSSCATWPTWRCSSSSRARRRGESRGLHYLLDYPDTDEVPRDTVVTGASWRTPGRHRRRSGRSRPDRTGRRRSAPSCRARWRCQLEGAVGERARPALRSAPGRRCRSGDVRVELRIVGVGVERRWLAGTTSSRRRRSDLPDARARVEVVGPPVVGEEGEQELLPLGRLGAPRGEAPRHSSAGCSPFHSRQPVRRALAHRGRLVGGGGEGHVVEPL